MRRIQQHRLIPVMFAAFIVMAVMIVRAQDADKIAQVNVLQVPAGQKMNVEGVILSQQPDSVILRSTGGANYSISITDNSAIKEKKSNPFRGAKKYSKADLVPGLHMMVKGSGNQAGAIVASEIRFTKDDFVVAQTMDARVVPVEKTLADTRVRLTETEQNARRMSGQVQELSAITNAAREGAKTAQETADNAMNAAGDARTRADNAKAGVQAANERITSLDDYAIKSTATVHFKAGSAVLSKEDKSELEKLADMARNERGYVIEVAGFASSDGNEDYNRKLSKKRADAVIQYMAENYSIPLRRFVTPMGYGIKQPVADNGTRAGRMENRRVEVRILTSRGLIPAENPAAGDMPISGQ